MRLTGKVAMITGGANGIGRQVTEVFAKEGAKVAICDIADEEGEEVENVIREAGGEARFFKMDVSDREDVNRTVEKIERQLGSLDILINNAGINRDAKLLDMTEEEWDQVINVNLKGAFNCTQAVAPGMVERESGSIVNASSVVALYGNYGQTNYAASKAGLIAMTKVWARELGPSNVTVNAVAPGFIKTQMMKGVPESVIEKIEGQTPLDRLGEPEEVAKTYLFLASDEASYVNGSVFSVDGGLVV
ncbi:3-oxoacyl-[acyl-carrier-protein] reductase [Candidatus Bipolaricaulota bacterium]|nr:3-oxoacyl-[acyl-carrier-protein] reductase [Candidatus Bipolaricaulota bacterium]MBS3792605.1 3-oxoacyl-[acyl-carrier-protein] reductase [Candidatus Bipolaricaulota bacterium]